MAAILEKGEQCSGIGGPVAWHLSILPFAAASRKQQGPKVPSTA